MRAGGLARMVLGGLIASTASAAPAAVLVNFTDYANGEIVGQPSGSGTQWAAGSGSFVVDGGVGKGGGKGLLTAPTYPGSTNINLDYLPTAAEIGGDFATQKVVNFSFDFNLAGPSTGNVNGYRIFFRSNNTNTLQIDLNSNGNVTVAGTTANVTRSAYHTLSGVVDYATSTYSITIDDAALVSNIAFAATPVGGYTTYGGFRIFNRLTEAQWPNNDLALDNFTIAVPEPASLAALAVPAGAMLLRRRTARR